MGTAITRKKFLIGAGAVSCAAMLRPFVAHAARPTVIKIGTDVQANNPVAKYLFEVSKELKAETNGEVDVQIFLNSELGGSTQMVAEVRSGAIQMTCAGDNTLATVVPSASIDNMGFAFQNEAAAWAALDGSVGDVVRQDIEKAGMHPMHAIWDQGFHSITTSTKPIKTVEDLRGFKIRVAPAETSVSLFKALGASPATMNIDEVYTALQTSVVNGEENPPGIVETMKFYEVQKYYSLTKHLWLCYWMVMNGAFWKSLPTDHQKVIAAVFDTQALKQRVAMEAFNNSNSRQACLAGP